MKLLCFASSLFLSLTTLAAEPALDSFKFELSCMHHNDQGVTVAVHAVIDFDGKKATCEASEGRHIRYDRNYEIAFKCEKPIAVSTDSHTPFFTWVLSAPADPKDQVSKLMVLLDHKNFRGSGFATAADGMIYPVSCKKW